MKKLFLFFTTCLFCFVQSCFAGCECEDADFKQKLKKIALNVSTTKTLGLKVQKIKEEAADEIIKTTGQIEGIPYNKFDVNCPVTGHVESIYVDLGDVVMLNQPLLAVQSTEISMLLGDINQFKAELDLAKSNFERERSLYDEGISPKKDYDVAKASLASAEAKLSTLKKNLRILTNNLDISNSDEYVLPAHASGIISERDVTVGQVVTPDQVIFRGIDLSTVWASADIYEKDTGKVALGQKVTVTLDGIPGKVFEGKISYLGATLNEDSRTLPVKATLQNINNELKPGSFIQLAIHTGKSSRSIVIPRTALVETDSEDIEGRHKHFVYVKEHENSFVPRRVEVEQHDSDSVEVISGLSPGELVVIKGAYQLQFAEQHNEENNPFPFKLDLKLVLILAFALGFLIILLFRKKKQS